MHARRVIDTLNTPWAGTISVRPTHVPIPLGHSSSLPTLLPPSAHARLSQVIEDMMSFADKDGDGKVSFEEFKKIMLYKPAPEGDTPAEGYPSTA